MGRRLLQSERNAMLLIDVLRSNVKARRFVIHDFVVMPDHLHLLITVHADMTIERAMQLIKGGFSYRLKKEFGYTGEVWQRGFSEMRVNDREGCLQHREYVAENPVKAGLATSSDEFPYCYSYLARQKQTGAKAQSISAACGTTEVVP
jgi:putative transposase